MKHSLALALLGSFAGASLAAPPGAVTRLTANAARREYSLTTTGGIVMKVVFYRPDVFRVLAAPNGHFPDPGNDPKQAQIVIDDRRIPGPVRVAETATDITFATDKVALRVRKADCRLGARRPDGSPVWEEVVPLDFGGKATVQTLTSSADEAFFGGGQQNGFFAHTGTRIAIEADGNWDEGGHPNPAPFFMSTRGYGVLRNTFSPGAYDFTDSRLIRLSHDEKRFDAYFFFGPGIHRVLDLYTQFTGRPNFVPIWALELGDADAWMTRDRQTKEPLKDKDGNFVEITPDCVRRNAEKYRAADMPGGWLLVNDGYGCGYVELPRVVKELAALGFKTGLWTEKGLEKTKWEVGAAGTRLQKLDVAWTGPAYQFSLDANRQAWESLRENSDSRPFVWTVQGWAGTQRYSVCWTGDQYGSWDLIRYHIPTLIGSGLSGQAYATTDVDGIFGGSPETFTRDLQWKCFTPVLYVMNGWSNLNKSPWSYPEPYLSINRDYLKRKMRLTPYIYRYVREAYDTGAPIVRGMVWNFPDDRRTWDRSTRYQYMLGDWLLVAPVFSSMKVNGGWRREDIYLPAGRWIDYWDGTTVDGPATIDAYPVTLEKLPVIVRAGAIIPMYPEMLFDGQKPKDPLTLDIYPYGDTSFELYEDDGVTRKYEKGESARQSIRVKAPKGTAGDITVSIGRSVGKFDGRLAARVYELDVHTPLKPVSVTMDGAPLLQLTEPRAFPPAVSGWYFDPADRRGIAHIRLPRTATNREVTVVLDIDESQTVPASPPYPLPPATGEPDKSQFEVSASSAHGGNGIRNAFDGTPETIWHTDWGDKEARHPFTVDIDLGSVCPVNGFRYLPRQESSNGRIANYDIYASTDKDAFGEPVAKGTWPNTKDEQSVSFPTTNARYIRLKVLSEVNGKPYASAAEFDIVRADAARVEATEYLSDLETASATGVWHKDRSAGGNALSANGKAYEKGIGMQAPCELAYRLDGRYRRLTGFVAMDDDVGSKGSVVFRATADGKTIFEGPSMTGDSVKQLLDLNLTGVNELRLILLDAGDGNADDHGDWLDMRLTRNE